MKRAVSRVAVACISAASIVLGLLGPLPSAAAAEGSWSSLGSPSFGLPPDVIEADSDGNVYVGYDGSLDPGNIRFLAQWNGTQWSSLACTNSGLNHYVKDMDAGRNGDLYVGGYGLLSCNGVSGAYVYKWNSRTQTWSSLGNPQGFVLELAYDSLNNHVYVWRWQASWPSERYILSRWNGSSWTDIPDTLGNRDRITSLETDALGNLYVGGNFTSIGGVAANYVAKYDGTTWSALGTGLGSISGTNFSGWVTAIATSGSTVYVAGNFGSAGSSGSNFQIAAWNGSSWSSMGSGSTNVYAINGLAVSGSNLYAAGSFSSIRGVSAANVAKWNGSSWSALADSGDGAFLGIAASGSSAYVAGNFGVIDGVSFPRVARWSLTPSPTPTFDTPVRTAGGFTVNVTNYNAAYSWTPTRSAGTVTAGTPSGSTLPLTVTGLSAGASSTVTVTTSRSGYSNASATVTGQAKSTQTVTWSPTTAVTVAQSPLTPSTSATALGGAPISYAVVAGYTTTTCAVDSSTGQLTYTGTGACTVRATAASTSAYLEGTTDVTFTVSKATQTVSWSPTAALTTVQSPVTPTAAATSGDGAITYAKVSSTTTTCTVDPTSGQLAYTGTGACVVRATAAATDLYNAGSADVTFTISKATPALTWAPSTVFTVPDASTTFTAATTDSDGAVSYSLSTNTAGCTLSGRVLSFTQEGSCAVTASVAGTDTYNAASSVITFAISKATQSVTWAPSATLTLASLSATLPTATTTGDGAITYTVTSAGGTGCAFANPSSPVLTYSSAGTCSVTATAAATTGYSQGTRSASITISLATPTMTWTPTTTLTMPAATVSPTTASTSGDGAITYAVTSGSHCSVDTNTGALTYTATGPCQVTATSAATSRYAAGSTAVTFTVSLASQTITGAASSTSLQPGGTATLTHTGSTGTGAITWALTSGAGVCSLTGTTVTALADGTCTLTVSIAADPTYAAASHTLTITNASPRGGGGGAGTSAGGGSTAAATPGGTPATGTSSTATAASPVSADSVRPPGTASPTAGRALPPPPQRVNITPMQGKARAKVVIGLPEGAGGASVLSTVVVVRDSAGKIVSRIEMPMAPDQQQAEVIVPYVADGYTVNVYNVNEVGVSTGAMRTSPLVHATTISRRSNSGTPTLFGAPLGRPITFAGGSASLDAQDKKQLREIARAARTSPDRLFVTGFARKGGTGTPSELASLSTTRAKNVATYLAQQGVRVWIRYWGAGTLNGTGSTSDRRVEIHTSNQPIPRSLVP